MAKRKIKFKAYTLLVAVEGMNYRVMELRYCISLCRAGSDDTVIPFNSTGLTVIVGIYFLNYAIKLISNVSLTLFYHKCLRKEECASKIYFTQYSINVFIYLN